MRQGIWCPTKPSSKRIPAPEIGKGGGDELAPSLYVDARRGAEQHSELVPSRSLKRYHYTRECITFKPKLCTQQNLYAAFSTSVAKPAMDLADCLHDVLSLVLGGLQT